MTEQGKSAKRCAQCAYWDRGTCRHGMVAENERGRGSSCAFFTRDASAFAFFVKEWRW